MAGRISPRTAEHEKIEQHILDAVQKGLNRIGDLVSYCGPELIDVNVDDLERELDVPQLNRSVETLVRSGALVRVSERGKGQLWVEITEQGREAAPPIAARESELVDTYGVHPNALRVLASIIEYEKREGSLPHLNALTEHTDLGLISYQIQPLLSNLIEQGLADEKGFIRFRALPTDRGHRAVEEFGDIL